jgi:hypothetical protein
MCRCNRSLGFEGATDIKRYLLVSPSQKPVIPIHFVTTQSDHESAMPCFT